MKQISAKTYQTLAHPTSFMQTPQMATQRQSQNQTTHFFQHDEEFALLNGTPYQNSKYLTYNIWFPDNLSPDFITELRTWCHAHHGLTLTITPATPISRHDNHGQILQNFPFDPSTFTRNHFKPSPPILTAPGTYKQWHYIVDLNQPYPTLLQKAFKPKVRHAITATQKTGIIVEPLTHKNLQAFTKTLSTTANRRHFSARDQKYYQSMLAAFKSDAYGLIAYIDPTTTHNLLTKIIKTSKNLKDGTDIAKKATRQLELIKNLQQKTPIYAGFFIDTPHETTYLAGGGPDQFLPFSPVYAILDHAMQHSIAKHIPRFNLYGVDARFDHPTGLLRFKQQFNGSILHLPGDFTTTLRPLTHLTLRLKNKL